MRTNPPQHLSRSLPGAVARQLLAALGLLATVCTAQAAGLRVVATDDRGVTLRLEVGDWSLSAPDASGRVRVLGVGGAHSLGEPGRALLPAWSTMLAVPPDASPTLRVLDAGTSVERTGVRMAIASKPSFRPDPDGGAPTPDRVEVPAIADGAWPPQPFVLGARTPFRGRVLFGLEVRPFRYDESAARLTATDVLTLRLDFNRPRGASAAALPAGEADPGMDAALETGVLNFSQARAWRVSPRGAASAAGGLFARPGAANGPYPFDETEPEVRVQIDSTALYLLPYDLLAPKGYPAGTPIAQVSVHRHEFVEGGSPAYETIDVPVDVEDVNANGVFDSGDRVWMYARNWNDRTRPSQYQRWWGDGDVVYVTRRTTGGARIGKRAGWRDQSGLSALASFPLTTHYEKNFAIIMPFIGVPGDTSVDVFHWTPYAFYYDRPDTILFEANDVDTVRNVSFTVNWVGRKFGDHYEWAAVRNGRGQVTSIADSVRGSGKLPFRASGTLRGSALSEGRTNALRIWGKSAAGPPIAGTNDFDASGLNGFDLTYWRRFNAVHDVLAFNSADASGEIQIHGIGFQGDTVRVYDVTDPENPVRLYLDESHFTRTGPTQFDLQDSVAAGFPHQYVAATVQEPRDPDFGPRVPDPSQVSFVARRALYAATGADYLLVTPEAFLPAANLIAAQRQAQGLRVLVAPAEAVYDEFNGGRHSAAALQRFIRYAYDQWSSRFVLLLGDGSLDAQGFSPRSGRDWIPILPTPGPVTVGDGFELVPSDNRYGCITGNCDPILGSGDVIPEMMIGRLPANSLADALAMANKIVGYETITADAPWRRRLLLSSDDAYSGDSFFGGGGGTFGCPYGWKFYEEYFVGLNQKVASIVTRDAGLAETNAELFNLRYYLANEPFTFAGADTCRPDRAATQARCHAVVTPALLSKLNNGVLWWNYQGHANEYVLTHENLYINSGDVTSGDDKFSLANDGKPFLFSAFSCHANMFARNDAGPNTPLGGCIGEDLLTLPNRGAIASWASVCYEVVPRDDSSHINVELARSMFAEPPADEFVPGDRGSRVVMGEVIQATFLRYLPTVFSSQSERGVGITYTLLGDPAQRISIGRPQSMVFANDSPVTSGAPVRLQTPGDSLQLIADFVSTARLDSVGLYENDGAGAVAIPASSYTLTPSFPDTAGGGVYGGRRFRLAYGTHLKARSYRYTLRSRDRDGLQNDFDVPFLLDATLQADGVSLHDGDDVSPRANLALSFVCPKPVRPATDLVLTVNGAAQAFTPTAAPGDISGREWILSWIHPEYAKDDYVVNLTVLGDQTVTRRFRVTTANGELSMRELFAFPNPFDNDGTNFSFTLAGSDVADVKVTVYTISGRVIYSNVVNGLAPGYHQLPWDGRDAEGAVLANGTYLYRVSATTAAGQHQSQLGRIVKLRKPRHIDIPTTTP